MKKLEKMKSVLMALFCAVALFGLSSCSDDDEPKAPETKVAGYVFEIVFNRIEETDNADLTDVTLHYVDQQGKKVDKKVSMLPKTTTIKSQLYKQLPGDLEVTLEETLKANLNLDKEAYKMGIDVRFSLTSVDAEGNIIDVVSTQKASTLTVAAKDLSKLYPKTTEYNYSIAADGKISAK